MVQNKSIKLKNVELYLTIFMMITEWSDSESVNILYVLTDFVAHDKILTVYKQVNTKHIFWIATVNRILNYLAPSSLCTLLL